MQNHKPVISNEQRTASTRAALIAAAREAFATKGYAETGTPELVRAAGVTRGALYHHYDGKLALFRAVVEAESNAVAAEIETGAANTGAPLDALIAGAGAYFTAMQAPGRIRLLLVDGPAVLGVAAMHAIDMQTSGHSLRAGLEAAMQTGAMRPLPIEALTALLSAAFDRGALEIAGGVSADDVEKTIAALLDGLRAG